MILAKNPNLINSLNRSHIHPSIRKYRHIERRLQGRENYVFISVIPNNLYSNK